MAKEAAAIAVNRIFKTFLTSPAATAVGGATDAAEAAIKGEHGEGAASLSAGTTVTAAELGDGDDVSESAQGGDAVVGNPGSGANGGTRSPQKSGMDAVPARGLGETQEKNVTDIGGGLRREPLTSEELEPLALTMSDFEEAVDRVQVSTCMRAPLCVCLDLSRVSRRCTRAILS